LPKVKVGTVGVQGAQYLQRRHIRFKDYKTVAAGLDALAAGDVEAIVYEAPILQYEVKQRGDAGLLVLDGTFDNHGYALALKQGSPIREAVNIALLQYTQSDDWSMVLAKYLGP
jgi:ABC-type amino acid transport substrate-binding protein